MEERPTKDPSVLDELLADGSMVLFHPGTRQLLTINPSAAFVWEHCDGTRTPEELEAELSSMFPSAETITGDVAKILSDLQDRGMLSSSRLNGGGTSSG